MRRSPWPLALVAITLGLLLGLQLRVQEAARARTQDPRPEDLARRLKAANDDRDRLQAEVAALQKRLAAVPAPPPPPDPRADVLSGLVAAEGPGVLVRLEPGTSRAQPGGMAAEPNWVHDEDLLRVVNELWASGAEAISVNGQRIATPTEIRAAGRQIVINGQPTAPPYELLAIGDPAVLEAAFRLPGGVGDMMKLWGIQVRVEKRDKLRVPAFRPPAGFRYARPVP